MNKLSLQSQDYQTSIDPLNSRKTISLTVPNEFGGKRLDSTLANLLPQYSRSQLSQWIKTGAVTVDDGVSIAKHKLIGGEKVKIFCEPDPQISAFQPEPLALDILFEDDAVLVLNKPAGVVVHPAAGNWSGTLLNGLLHHEPRLLQVPRAGIVHRLDKDTSGLMVVAKSLIAQNNLVKQLQERKVRRIYRSIVNGLVESDRMIETLIGRDPYRRTRMAVVPFGGKEAITHVKLLQHFLHHSYVECRLETGRTHQIRVHMRELGHPIVGDPVYGNFSLPASKEIKAQIMALKRQALHAYRLSFFHPISQEVLDFEAPLPIEMKNLLQRLEVELQLFQLDN